VDGTANNRIVLFAGDSAYLGKMLIYTYTAANPTAGTVEVAAVTDPVANLASTRGRKSADRDDYIILDDGRLLITSGVGSADLATVGNDISLIFDPSTDAVNNCTLTQTGPMNILRTGNICIKLGDGTVLMIGGTDANGDLVAASEEYDAVADTWTQVGGLAVPRSKFGYSLLSDGRVAVFGGSDANGNVLNSIEIYDPATDLWSGAGIMIHGRKACRAVLLTDGRILICGGEDANGNAIQESETYGP
jgi:N-acetylneuraminic acid mutarotase